MELRSGFVTTLHPWLSYQEAGGRPLQSQANPGHFWNDYRLGRASAGALIPKETTAVSALFAVIPELEGAARCRFLSGADACRQFGGFDAAPDEADNGQGTGGALTELASSCRYVELNHEPLVSVDFEQTEASWSY